MKAIFRFKNKQYAYKVLDGSVRLIHLGNIPEEETNETDYAPEYEKFTDEEWEYIFQEYNELNKER